MLSQSIISISELQGVYILELENDRYYVGESRNIEHRVSRHFDGDGAVWTQDHPPVRVVDTQEVEDSTARKKLEREVTLLMMVKVGWRKVRGGGWTQRELSKPLPLRVSLDDLDIE